MIVAAFLSLVQAFTPATDTGLTLRDIREAPPAVIGTRILGARGADVEGVEIQPGGMTPPGYVELRLLHRPRVIDENFCSQSLSTAALHQRRGSPPAAEPLDDLPLMLDRVRAAESIALAPGCRTGEGQTFAYINPAIPRPAAMELMRNFATLQRMAAAGARLPFRLTCRDKVRSDPNACRRGGRRALAMIRPKRTWLIRQGWEDSDLRLIIGERGGLYWEVRVQRYGTNRSHVTIVWEEPAPF